MQYCQTSLLVLQPTPFCNIDCSYCYLPHRTSTKKLSFELADTIFRKLFRFPTVRDSLTLVWHAGEPLVLPVSYYERMFALVAELAPPSLVITHSFQTNGTLISDAWCALFKKWRVNVGVSIDGPREFHDRYRKLRGGGGSFERTLQGLRKLQETNIPFHVISVLTVASMTQPEAMFDFYATHGIESVCFNIEEQEGANACSELLTTQGSDAQYRSFLSRFIELSLARQHFIYIREVEHALGLIRAHGVPVLNEQNIPLRIISVDCEGNLSTFSPELLGLRHAHYDSFCFGNLAEDDFAQIAARIEDSSLARDVALGVAQCAATCDYFGLCGGGAPSNKIFENGSAATTRTAHCRSFMHSIDVVLDLVDRLPDDIRQPSEPMPDGRPPRTMWPG